MEDTRPATRNTPPMTVPAIQKLLEVAESEVAIDFKPGTKCRSTVQLRSLHPTATVAFKVQTSSPAKFHVNPPSGFLHPFSTAALHVILRPQADPPSAFPRCPSDRFLIRASIATTSSSSFPSDNASSGDYDVKLRVAYIGPFLLRHAAATGDTSAVRHLLRRQPHLLPLLPSGPDKEGFRLVEDGPATSADGATTRGWTRVHAAASAGELGEMNRIMQDEGDREAAVEAKDFEGRTPLMVAAGRGRGQCVRELVARWGADVDARSRDGRTALYRAAAAGDEEMVATLVELGADAGLPTVKGRTAVNVAKDKGHVEVVEILERGEMVLTASRRGDLPGLRSLLVKRIGVQGHDQYGITALHSAAIKGHRDAVALLVDSGMEVEPRDVDGHTPLHLAVEGGSLGTVELLLALGADANAETKRGGTPLLMAEAMGHHAIAQLLRSREAASAAAAGMASSSPTSSASRCLDP